MVIINVQHDTDTHLHHDELRTVVTEAGNLIPDEHKGMLLGILDLQQATVEDIMTPINDIHGIDLDDDIDDIKKCRREGYKYSANDSDDNKWMFLRKTE